MTRALVVTLMVVVPTLPLGSCGKKPFDRECRSIQKIVPTKAHLVSMVGPKRTGNTTEASWQYQTVGGVQDAKAAFRSAVEKHYGVVREDESALSCARFDGHDSFYLILLFKTKENNSTSVSVVLKSMPD